jgi:ABC-type multidrug transport system permease subunit
MWLGIIFILIAITIGVMAFIFDDDDMPKFLLGMLFAMFAFVGILILISKTIEVSLSSNTLKIEVRETKVDGKVVKSDTVYIFTQKK